MKSHWSARFLSVAGMVMVALVALALAVALLGCESQGPTAPEPERYVATVVEPQFESFGPGDDVLKGLATGLAVRWYTLAGFGVTNTAGTTQYLQAFITGFDNQSVKIASKNATVANGTTWNYSFNRGCVQLDLAYQGGTIFAHSFYDKAGRRFSPGTNPEKIAECKPQPTPTPTPVIYCNEDGTCPNSLRCVPAAPSSPALGTCQP